MRTLILIVSMLIFSSCSNYDFKISELKYDKLKFSELPVTVKEFLIQPPEFDNENPSSLIFINSKESDRYVFEVVFNSWVSSWVDYMKLIDTKNKVSYRINQGVPSPFFVYENKLYIPNKYNIVVVNKNIEEVEFTCYILK
jgi:hypothetical protein